MNAHSRTKSKSRRIVDDRRRPRLLEEGNERRTQEVSRSDVDLGLSGKVLPYKQKPSASVLTKERRGKGSHFAERRDSATFVASVGSTLATGR